MSKYHLVCGLEVHTELKTASKMFCGCKNDPFNAPKPNIHTCPVCLGMPGGLPVPNAKAIEWTIKLGLFLGCKINLSSKFDRKNYFYPDLAKGYQISQYDLPFCYDGQIPTSEGVVRLERIHLEEDTGKLIHGEINQEKVSLIDFNRSGVPLVEIVTKPDITSPAQAVEYAKKLRSVVRYLGIGDADMEKGGMRLEANISLQTDKQHQNGELPNYKVEIKNINSFNFMHQAIAFEIERQTQLLDAGQIIPQETRGFNSTKQITFSQRDKENAADYRYFPDPDIPSLVFKKAQIERWRQELPPQPETIIQDWQTKYGLEPRFAPAFLKNKDSVSWAQELFTLAHQEKLSVNQLANSLVNGKMKSQINDKITAVIAEFRQSKQLDDFDEVQILKVIKTIIAENKDAGEKYRSGQSQVIGFFVGEAMKKIAKKVDAKRVKELIEKQLNEGLDYA